jgi:hypothetical protein
MAVPKQWSKVVAKAWADESYKERLIEDPGTVLREEGLDVPEGITLRVAEDTETERTLVLPPPPEEGGEIQNLEERLAAGSCCFCCCDGTDSCP